MQVGDGVRTTMGIFACCPQRALEVAQRLANPQGSRLRHGRGIYLHARGQ